MLVVFIRSLRGIIELGHVPVFLEKWVGAVIWGMIVKFLQRLEDIVLLHLVSKL